MPGPEDKIDDFRATQWREALVKMAEYFSQGFEDRLFQLRVATARKVHETPILTLTGVTTAGACLLVEDVPAQAILKRTIIEQQAGTAASFSCEVVNTSAATGFEHSRMDIILAYDSSDLTDPTLIDVSSDLIFKNKEGENKCYVTITPAGGSGDYAVKLAFEVASYSD